MFYSVFIENRQGLYRCMVCPDCQYEPLSRAITHESSVMHTNHARDFDRPAPMSSPPPMEAPLPEDNIMSEAMYDNEQTSAETHCNSGQKLAVSDSSEYAVGTIHGPAILGDSVDQLYDDWAGELSYLNEIDGVDEELAMMDANSEALDGLRDGGRSDGYEDVEDIHDDSAELVTGFEDELNDGLLLGQETITADERGKFWMATWY